MALGLLLLVGCDDRPDQWDAFVYPGTLSSNMAKSLAASRWNYTVKPQLTAFNRSGPMVGATTNAAIAVSSSRRLAIASYVRQLSDKLA